MTEIFEVIDGIPKISAEGLTVPELRAIWLADDTSEKNLANTRLVFIYHSIDPRSIYRNVDAAEREDVVLRDCRSLFGLLEWVLDEQTLEARNKYELLIKTAKIRYADSLKGRLDKMAKFFDSMEDYSNTKEVKEVGAIIKDSKEIINSISSAEEQAKKDIQSIDGKLRGSVVLSIFDKEEFGQ